jgi:hypothetical protein
LNIEMVVGALWSATEEQPSVRELIDVTGKQDHGAAVAG